MKSFCLICGKEIDAAPSKKRKFCSKKCMAKNMEGENNVNWKGDAATPQAGRARAEKLFACPQGCERHHIDGNPLNNDSSNIKIVTPIEHHKADGRGFKKGNCVCKGRKFSEETKKKLSAKAHERELKKKQLRSCGNCEHPLERCVQEEASL